MKIVVTGSSGLVGSALVPALAHDGHEVIRLTRAPSAASGTILLWDPDASRIIDRDRLEGLDAVIHLAGENISARRWTAEQKAVIRNSRVQGTGLLANTLAGLERKPRVFVSASAIGYYGDRGDEELNEASGMGSTFLAGVCRDWEEATAAASEAGIRTINLRLGFILSGHGGGLAKMLPPFRLGLGGHVGSGRQWMSWIALDDVVGVIRYAIASPHVRGPLNAVSPRPVINRDFTRTLGNVLSRPAMVPLPAFLAKILLGGMADDLLLASARVVPAALRNNGFAFEFPDLKPALHHVLNESRAS